MCGIKLQGRRYFAFGGLFLYVSMIAGCSDATPKAVQPCNEPEAGRTKEHKPGSSYSDSIKINSPVAVFYFPDSLQLENLKRITDAGIFASTMHDCLYQMRNCRRVLKKDYGDIQIIEVTNARYLVFEMRSGEKEYVDLNTHNDPCGLFVFNGMKSAKLVDMTNVDTELGFYFK